MDRKPKENGLLTWASQLFPFAGPTLPYFGNFKSLYLCTLDCCRFVAMYRVTGSSNQEKLNIEQFV
jgi:hypothetical protein